MATLIEGLLTLAQTSGKTVYDTEVPTSATAPYAFITAPDFRDVLEALAGPVDYADYFQLTCVGTSIASARVVQASLKAVLHKKAPTVTGYSTDVRRTAAGVFADDVSIALPGTGPVVYCVDTYHYIATPTI